MTAEASTPRNTRNPLLKVLIPMALILAIVVGGLLLVKSQLGSDPQGHSALQPAVGATVPDFTLHKFPEGSLQASTLGKKVVVINFWATWCEACIVEMPSLLKLRETYKNRGLELIAVNLDDQPANVLPGALKELGIDFPVYLDPENKLADIFDVHAIPLTAIIDGNRNILYIKSGERDWMSEDIRTKIEAWLAT